MLSKKEAYEVGFDHGFTMAQESGVADAGCDGWDGMLINADPSFARENFGWDGCDSSDAAKELLAEYCRGAQEGANEAVKTVVATPMASTSTKKSGASHEQTRNQEGIRATKGSH